MASSGVNIKEQKTSYVSTPSSHRTKQKRQMTPARIQKKQGHDYLSGAGVVNNEQMLVYLTPISNKSFCLIHLSSFLGFERFNTYPSVAVSAALL